MRPQMVRFEGVSKFYGEILGVNQVDLTLESGITALVGPNGSGKTTLMNLATGLLQPTEGEVRVLGQSANRPEEFFGEIGYCAQFDSFPRGLSGRGFLLAMLGLHGIGGEAGQAAAARSLDRVGLAAAADRPVAAYSKGMRQRVKLAQALAHDPSVVLLDEPLNGLDPMARAETMAVLKELAAEEKMVLVSSHILHEIDAIADRVILMNSGYIVAEGGIQGVRAEMDEHPLQIKVRCDFPGRLAERIFREDHAVEVLIHSDRLGLDVRTTSAIDLYRVLSRAVLEDGLDIEGVAPSDDDVHAVYDYLIGNDGEAR